MTVAGPQVFVYRVEHDRGLAPNPFFRVCSLAVCMARVRAIAEIGDLVLGTAGYGRKLPVARPAGGSVVFVMEVTAITDFHAFHRDYPRKRPVMNGSRLRAAGDAIYWREGGEWCQHNSLHSELGGVLSRATLEEDVLTADRILLSTRFTYWGDRAPRLPAAVAHLGGKSIRYKRHLTRDERAGVIAWATAELGQGRVGEPIDWQA
jgi:hypothetical protein